MTSDCVDAGSDQCHVATTDTRCTKVRYSHQSLQKSSLGSPSSPFSRLLATYSFCLFRSVSWVCKLKADDSHRGNGSILSYCSNCSFIGQEHTIRRHSIRVYRCPDLLSSSLSCCILLQRSRKAFLTNVMGTDTDNDSQLCLMSRLVV